VQSNTELNQKYVLLIIATASSTNAEPMANAGIDQVVAPGTTVRLTGLGSTDVERDVLTYRWGSRASLSAARPCCHR